MIRNTFLLCIVALFSTGLPAQPKTAVKVGVVGLTHDHVHWILGYQGEEIEIVGIVEPDKAVAQRYADQYGFALEEVYSDIETMIEKARPDAVTAFTSIFGHLEVVEKCAPRGIHVMVEKPLAVNKVHALKMANLAKKHQIHLLTNYETTWYPSNHEVYSMKEKARLGELRKIVVHDGHEGPAEIGVSKEFLAWLTDPDLNGGGAIIDFGCYGANLITWLMDGQKPLSVTAVTQQIKPEVYPEVDDEATVILTYPEAQGIIQASWNWPFSRKDMEVYGTSGYAVAVNGTDLRYRVEGDEHAVNKSVLSIPYDNPFSYLAAVVNGEVTVSPSDLSSLELNLTVVEILDAAILSSQLGKTVFLEKE